MQSDLRRVAVQRYDETQNCRCQMLKLVRKHQGEPSADEDTNRACSQVWEKENNPSLP